LRGKRAATPRGARTASESRARRVDAGRRRGLNSNGIVRRRSETARRQEFGPCHCRRVARNFPRPANDSQARRFGMVLADGLLMEAGGRGLCTVLQLGARPRGDRLRHNILNRIDKMVLRGGIEPTTSPLQGRSKIGARSNFEAKMGSRKVVAPLIASYPATGP